MKEERKEKAGRARGKDESGREGLQSQTRMIEASGLRHLHRNSR